MDYKGRIGKDGVLNTVEAGLAQYRKVMAPYYKVFLEHANSVEDIHEKTVNAVTGDEDHDETILSKAVAEIKGLPSVLKKFNKTEMMGNIEVFPSSTSLDGRDLKVKQSPIPCLSKDEVVKVAELIIEILGSDDLESPYFPYPDYDTEPEFWQGVSECVSYDSYSEVSYFQFYYDWDLPYGSTEPKYNLIDALAKLLIASIKK